MIFIIFLLNIVSALLSMYIPFITGNLFDELISMPNMEIIYRFCIYLVAIMAGMLVFGYICARVSAFLKAWLSYEVNYDILCHIQNASLKRTSEINPTYVNHRINCDVNTVLSFALEIVTGTTINVIKLIVLLVFFACVNLKLAVIVFFLDLFYFFFFMFFKGKLEVAKANLKESGNRYFRHLQEQISNIKFVRALSLKNLYHGRLDSGYQRLNRSITADIRINYGLKVGESATQTLAQIAIFVVGGVGLLNHSMTVGVFTILINYLNMIIGCTNYCVSIGNSYVDAKIAYQRLKEFEEFPADREGTNEVDRILRMELCDISFGYQTPIISHFSYEFTIGSIYAICGANGRGKSTLLDIMAGLYPGQYDGVIYINNTDMDELNKEKLRNRNVSYCMQKSEIIDGSFAENVMLGKESVDGDYLETLVTGFGLEHLAAPERKDILINTDIISGGEAQKISLIRCLLKKDSDIYIFDEPTNNLDEKSQRFLFDIINRLKEKAIVIIATHDEKFAGASTEKIEII